MEGPKPKSDTTEAFAIGHRMNAVAAIRNRAERLRRYAARWDALANSLEEIERHAASQSVDGGEGGPHIGVGSPAEELLWELASRGLEI